MQSRNHVYTQPGKRFKRIYPYITFGILQVRENEISLRKWRGAVLRIAHLWGKIGHYISKESTCFASVRKRQEPSKMIIV